MASSPLFDSHCHLGIDCNEQVIEKLAEKLRLLPTIRSQFHIMSTYSEDVQLLQHLLSKLSDPLAVVPYFGVHPWYSHLYCVEEAVFDGNPRHEMRFKVEHYSRVLFPTPTEAFIQLLPMPISIQAQMERYRELISKLTSNFGIGEIGLDKLFRVPNNGFFGNKLVPNDLGNKLSPYRVSMDHQKQIFDAQLQFASQLKKQVSLHCVKAHGPLYDLVLQYDDVSAVILHSFSGSFDQSRLWLKRFEGKLFFSFSNCINGVEAKSEVLKAIVAALHDNQILVETDYPLDDRLLGDPQDYWRNLHQIWQKICQIKGWNEADTHIIEQNMIRSIS